MKSVIFCWLNEITLSLHPAKPPQITKHIIVPADKNLATWGRIQRDERWRWSTSKEECHLLLTQWNHFIPSSRKATANHKTHRFPGRQKPSHLRSHSTRRKMTMIYLKRRVSSFADSLKSVYAMSSRGLQNEINGFLNCLNKVFSSCRIHLRTAIPDRELQHPCLCHFTKPIQIRIYITKLLQSSLTAELQYQTSVPQPRQV